MTAKREMDEAELRRLAVDPLVTLRAIAVAMGCSIACVISRCTVLGIERPKSRRRFGHSAGLDPDAEGLGDTKDRKREMRERVPWPITAGFEDAKVPRETCLGRISARSPERSASTAAWAADAA
jgi:hypothetical protein